jgi:N-acetylmuramoyl-L-alanine amidase
MRVFLIVLFLALGALSSPAQSNGHSIERTTFNGKEYVRLADWARSRGFDVRWLKTDELLQISNGATRIVFVANSREARFNNIQVWLLLPLETRGERVFVSQLDLKTTVEPLLSPVRMGAKIRSICLDAGHGGKDPGNRNGRQNEKQYTLALAKELAAQLKKAGFKVSLTRNWDSYVERAERPATAKRQKADLFVSLHFNSASSGQDEARGAETYALTPAGGSSTAGNGNIGGNSYSGNRFNDSNLLLAFQIQKSLVAKLGVEDRGVRRARFEVLRGATMPGVLVEGGFLSHPAESKKIFDAAYRREMAKAIVEGIQNYKRAVE